MFLGLSQFGPALVSWFGPRKCFSVISILRLGSCEFGACNIAELWGLREGLALCVDVHAQAVEVELDAAAAISLISCNSRSNGDFSGLVDDCRDLLLQLPQAKVVHCYREANFCADALAKLGASSSDAAKM
ncbi:putative ribonuclease h protein [Quercus suber]|uniref:Ribonuclease h protein n=1 Tax=Quercus suber TaxID=58331 RepID=A0AAW0IN51_QUESU